MSQMNLFTGSERDPKKYIYDALTWIAKDYPDRWLRFINLCEDEQAAGNPRIQRDQVYLLARQHGLPITECDEYRNDHNLFAALSRYALMFRPKLAGVLHPKEQPWDNCGINFVEEWKCLVNPFTPFAWEDWREAKEAYRRGDVSVA